MSRLAKKQIVIPTEISVEKNEKIIIFTKKTSTGELVQKVLIPVKSNIDVAFENGFIKINFPKADSAYAGLVYSLINNSIKGLTTKFSKNLVLTGLGYKVALVGSSLSLNIGYSHSVIVDIPKDVSVVVTKDTEIAVTSDCKQKLGLFTSKLVNLKKKDVYHGKGIRFVGEKIILKAGKKK